MAKHPRAKVVPFSSVVGTSVTLHNADGSVGGQLAILNVISPPGASREDLKQRQVDIAEEVAMKLNAFDEMRHLLEVVHDNETDRVKDNEARTMSDITLHRINGILRGTAR